MNLYKSPILEVWLDTASQWGRSRLYSEYTAISSNPLSITRSRKFSFFGLSHCYPNAKASGFLFRNELKFWFIAGEGGRSTLWKRSGGLVIRLDAVMENRCSCWREHALSCRGFLCRVSWECLSSYLSPRRSIWITLFNISYQIRCGKFDFIFATLLTLSLFLQHKIATVTYHHNEILSLFGAQ